MRFRPAGKVLLTCSSYRANHTACSLVGVGRVHRIDGRVAGFGALRGQITSPVNVEAALGPARWTDSEEDEKEAIVEGIGESQSAICERKSQRQRRKPRPSSLGARSSPT